ncbi:MAG TPA: hypothetical protein VN765_07470 [Candidatus Acidoferrum sp.]|nr:hypothetical protein [Candidatus Acidoferrum sp.]
MKHQPQTVCSLAGALLGLLFLPAASCLAGHYTNFTVSIYGAGNLANSNSWGYASSQLPIDKVYIEAQRDRHTNSDATLQRQKKFFLDAGVQVAGGMCLSDGSVGGQFRSFCYTDPNDRDFIKNVVELTARNFDEVIQDDFFFVTTKTDSDIAAKGNRSWTQFRLDLMREAAENLVMKPAKAVNPKVKMVIKYPNWYEHFQGLGFDLDKTAKIFDGIYTGTETRESEITDQNLQAYESYLIIRYFENIAPGRNGGGWVDTFDLRYSDRYAEQLVDTVFAKAREMTLFNGVAQPASPGARTQWQDQHTSFDFNSLRQSVQSTAGSNAAVTWGRVAGDALTKADAFLGKMGKPIGIQSYKPFQSTGEDFLHNYLGMIGIPIDLYPYFPTNANMVLLTECAKFDPDIVAKIKAHLAAGKSVVITSGLLHALQDKGIEDIAEIQYSDHKVLAHEYASIYGAGSGSALAGEQEEEVLFPEIIFLTNDSWALLRAMAHGRGYPLLLLNRYGKGILYVWTMPENFNDLYRLPQSAISTVKNYVMAGFPIRLDAPAKVALFAYDNNTCIVESYLPTACEARVSVAREFTKLRNLVTGEVIAVAAQPAGGGRGGRGGGPGGGALASFNVHLLPHSYAAFIAEP